MENVKAISKPSSASAADRRKLWLSEDVEGSVSLRKSRLPK